MRSIKKGFTLIEVSLFLVITAAVFVGIAVGTQNSIFQQRYNDTVQNYADFLRGIYSQVNNVQSDGNGQSDKAIYGKLVTYGQTYNLAGEEIDDDVQHVFTYDVVGDASGDLASGNILEKLDELDANVVIRVENNGSYNYRLVGYPADYVPRWGAGIQTNAGWSDNSYTKFTGALLIVRHPSSGKIYTLVIENEVIEVNKILRDYASSSEDDSRDDSAIRNLLKKYLVLEEDDPKELFHLQEVNFCINPNGNERSNLRRDVRLVKGTKNSSGIQIMSDEECNE